MTPEQAAAIRAAYERQVLGPLAPPDTPVAFYYRERFGPQPTSAQLWQTIYELTVPSDARVYHAHTTDEDD